MSVAEFERDETQKPRLRLILPDLALVFDVVQAEKQRQAEELGLDLNQTFMKPAEILAADRLICGLPAVAEEVEPEQPLPTSIDPV